MRTWHYRLIKHIYPKGEVYYGVYEYYPTTEEVEEAFTLSPVEFWGETPDYIQWLIVNVLNDLAKHKIIEIKHDDYGVVYAENTRAKPCAMCGDKR